MGGGRVEKLGASAIRSRPQHWEDRAPLPSWPPRAVHTLPQEHARGSRPARAWVAGGGGGGAATTLRTEVHHDLPFGPSPGSCKPLISSRIPKSDGFCSCSGCVEGKADSWHFLLFRFPKIRNSTAFFFLSFFFGRGTVCDWPISMEGTQEKFKWDVLFLFEIFLSGICNISAII